MRGIRLVIFILLLSMFTSMAHAADFPAKGSNFIHDTAGMIPSELVKELEKAAGASAPYTFHILTVESLGSVEAEVYAKQVYDTWSLRADDILILLSKMDRRIQLYFLNVPLQKKFDALPEDYAGSDYATRSSIDRLIGKNFTPLAKEGDFGTGLMNLITATNTLTKPVAETSTSSQPVVEPSASPKPDIETNVVPKTETEVYTPPKPDAEEVTPVPQMNDSQIARSDQAQEEPFYAKSTTIITGIAVLGCVILALVIYFVIRYRMRVALKKKALISTEANSIELLHAQENLRPLLDLYVGVSAEKTLLPLSSEINEHADLTQKLIDSITNHKIKFFIFGATELDQLVKRVNDLDSKVKQLSASANELVELDQSNSREVEEMKIAIQAVSERASELAHHYQMNLKRIWEEIEVNKEKAEAIYKLQLVELIDAKKMLEPQRKQTTLHNHLFDALPSLLTDQKEGPRNITEVESNIHMQLRDNRLELIEFNPFEMTNYALNAHKLLCASLESGDLEEAHKQSQDLHESLQVAVQMIIDRVKLRDSIEQDTEKSQQFIQSFVSNEDECEDKLSKMKSQFHESDWSTMPSKYELAIQSYKEVVASLPAAILSFDEQRYQAARKQVDHILQMSEQASSAMEESMLIYTQAVLRREAMDRDVSELWAKFQEAYSLISLQDISLQSGAGKLLAKTSDTIRKDKGNLDQVLWSSRTRLVDAERMLKSLHNDITLFEKNVEQAVQLKKQAEREIDEVQRNFEKVSKRTRNRDISSSYSYHYQMKINDANDLFTRGLYADVSNRLSEASQYIGQMQSEYDAIIHEEKRREEEERRRREEEDRRRREERRRQKEVDDRRRREKERRSQEKEDRRRQASSSSSSYSSSDNGSDASSGSDSYRSPRGSSGGDNW
ncbi:TPM domain-containing protein [Paenibacillus sp. KN14-4R]|uniref:TPM domain-containing protein n=1 Tax=Paenibacillus sp. KN14-4R TaxID=3445773 RepID=UPI003F9ECA3E